MVHILEDALAPIAKPLASGKLLKRLHKLVTKATKEKASKRGVKEAVKAIRKGSKGLVILAGDIYPIDVLSHVPVLCEEAGIPYVYVPSKAALGAAANSKRATSCILVPTPGKDKESVKKAFDKCIKEVKALHE